MTETRSPSMEITYESDASSSYMVLKLDAEQKVQEYQVEMIANNPNPSFLSMDIRKKNKSISICYNITSKLSLKQFLQRRKLKRNELVDICRSITHTLLQSKNYFLFTKGFILNEEQIFINPGTLEISMAYVPMDVPTDTWGNIKTFIIDIIVHSAQMEDEPSDNFLQRILGALRSETFHLSNFYALLVQLRYNQGDHITLKYMESATDNSKKSRKIIEPQGIDQHPTAEKRAGIKQKKEKTSKVGQGNRFHIMIGSVQVLAVMILLLVYQYILPRMSEDGNIDPVSAGMVVFIVGALDFLIVKNLLEKKEKSLNEPANKTLDNGEEKNTNKDIISVPCPVIDLQEFNTAKKEVSSEERTVQTPELFFSDYSASTVVLKPSDEEKVQACLKSVKGELTERIFINKPNFVIGRLASQVDFASSNHAVGKIHAEIIKKDSTYYVTDLNSRNGTFINGTRISSNKEFEIHNGDLVSFANSEYIFELI